MTSAGVVIIGAGLAGVTVAQVLRAQRYDRPIVMLGEEDLAPYDRTTLSKSVLANRALLPPTLEQDFWYAEANVQLILGTRVDSFCAASRIVRCSDGTQFVGDSVVLTTGSSPRKPNLPGVDGERVFALRSAKDVGELHKILEGARRIAIVGGGLIGCEVATTARTLGLDVDLIECSSELLQRLLGERIGLWMRGELEAVGVRCHVGFRVLEIASTPESVVVRGYGTPDIEADAVLISVGARPNDELARLAGLKCSDGVEVDASGRTSADGIYAAGDVARWPLRSGDSRSLETYLNAQDQARAVAEAIVGNAAASPQEPRSWTEIAGHRIQVMGDFAGGVDADYVCRGDLADKSALLFRLSQGQVIAALAVNQPKNFAVASRLVDRRTAPNLIDLANPECALRALLSAS